jgi:hypothetical protein
MVEGSLAQPMALPALAAPHDSEVGTELPTSALQRFRPESEGQLTFGGRDSEGPFVTQSAAPRFKRPT